MSDIFLSYAREEREKARVLAAALERLGWSVFWDLTIPAGLTWDDFIGAQLEDARCVVVAWSEASATSKWVKEEAREGRDRDILVPVFFEHVKPPFGFRGLQAADLTTWNGGAEVSAFQQLVNDMERILGNVPDRVVEGGRHDESGAVAKSKEDEKRRNENAEANRNTEAEVTDIAAKDASQRQVVRHERRRAEQGRERQRNEKRSHTGAVTSTEVHGEETRLPVVEEARRKGEVAERKAKTEVRARTERQEKQAASTGALTESKAPTWEADAKGNPRILIPAGEFFMGSPEGMGDEDERPVRSVQVSSFYIQQHPVTNEEYRRLDPDHDSSAPPNCPVVLVTWLEATAYAEWLGGSLPTEAQWEFAARGSEGRTYPWGDKKPTHELAAYGRSFARIAPAASHPKGATPEGVLDLAGNVWEWCLDWYGAYRQADEEDPEGPKEGSRRVIRGGAFSFGPSYLRGATRNAGNPEIAAEDCGFRVAFIANSKAG